MAPVIIAWMLLASGNYNSSPNLITRTKSEASCRATLEEIYKRKREGGLTVWAICTPEYN